MVTAAPQCVAPKPDDTIPAPPPEMTCDETWPPTVDEASGLTIHLDSEHLDEVDDGQ